MTDVTTSGAPDTAGGGAALTFRQTGRWPALVGLVVTNGLLNIITLTLYRFWARTAVRKRLWSSTEINGEPLEYTGRGMELFVSFLFVTFAIFLPIVVALTAAAVFFLPLYFVLYAILLVLAYPVLGLAIYRARRYRMSRTTWRGVRFGMQQNAWSFGWAFFGWVLLSVITLGWYAPAAAMRIERRLWSDTTFGDRSFQFGAGVSSLAGPLYRPFALAWFGGVAAYAGLAAFFAANVNPTDPTSLQSPLFFVQIYGVALVAAIVVGVASLWYVVATMRRIAELVSFEGVSFRLNATAPSYLWLYVGNVLIVIFTLGFGMPFAQLRNFRYVFNRLTAEGALDIAAITQNPDTGPTRGEGLADAFDIGAV